MVLLWGRSARSPLRVLPLGRPPPRRFLPGIDRYSVSGAGCGLKPQLQHTVHGRSIESFRSGGRFDGGARRNSAGTHPKEDHRRSVRRDSEISAYTRRVKSQRYLCRRNTGRPGHALSCAGVRLNSQQNGAGEGRALPFTHRMPLWLGLPSLPCRTPIARGITTETRGGWREITSKTASRTFPLSALSRPPDRRSEQATRAIRTPGALPNRTHVRHCDIRGK